MTDAIVIENVSKSFGAKRAVQGLDLVVPAGSLCGFIGPNGAGKTTTIRMVMAILFPDAGRLSVLGKRSAIESKDRIGYLPEERGVYRKMKVGAFLRLMARLKGVDGGADLSQRVRDWLERVELPGVEKKRCEELSKGMQQKVQFIATVIHEPELLILDEPFSGLDPVNMRLLRELIHDQHRSGRTVIFSTHVMQQAEDICDHIFMIHNGRKVLDSTVPEIRMRHDPKTIVVEPTVDGDWAARLGSLAGVTRVDAGRGGWELHISDTADPQGVIRDIVGIGPVRRVEIRRPTLEDVFIEIVESGGGHLDPAERASISATPEAEVAAVGGEGGA